MTNGAVKFKYKAHPRTNRRFKGARGRIQQKDNHVHCTVVDRRATAAGLSTSHTAHERPY